MKNWHRTVWLLWFSPLIACAEVIDLGTESGESLVVIYGRFTSGDEGNILEIARTSGSGAAPSPVSGATVMVMAASGDEGSYQEMEPGRYVLARNTIYQYQSEFTLHVDLPNGSRYQSQPQTMPQRVGEDQLTFEANTIQAPVGNNVEVSRNVVQLYMSSEIFRPEEAHFIRWNILETYLFPEKPHTVNSPDAPPQWCYITNDLEGQEVFLYDGTRLKTPRIASRLMTNRRVDHAFVSAYYFQVVQSSLSSDAFRFWNEINQVSNAQGSIFDKPLGPVTGNIFNVDDPDEEVLGYFEVSRVDTTRLFLRREDIPFAVNAPCPIVGQADPECLNCLLLKNSMKVKPHFVD